MRSLHGMALGLGLIVVGLAARSTMAEAYIVKGGAPQAQIVIAENPTRTQRLAAEELRDILRKISGAELAITADPSDDVPVRLYVGRSAHTERLDVRGEAVPGDGFRMVSGDTWLALVGDDSDYGPAAEPMQAFIEYSETNWWKMTKEEGPINRSLELLAAAAGAAGDDTIHARRVALVQEYLEPLKQLAEKVAIGRQDMPSARVYQRRGRAITIDGKLDDEFWRSTAHLSLREIETGRKPQFETRFSVGWKDDSLYFGIRCEEPDTQNLKIGTTEHDGMNMWNGDVVEILLETQNHAYYQIAVNPAGVLFDADRARGIRSLWESEAEVGVDVGEESWTLEIRFPIADEMQEENLPDQLVSGRPPTAGQPWYFNIGRKRVRDSGIETLMFSPTGRRSFHVQEKFGKLYLE